MPAQSQLVDKTVEISDKVAHITMKGDSVAMNTVDPQQFLEDQFPKKFWHLIPTTLRAAYSAANALADSEPILQVESAQDNLGRIISWATDLGFKRLIETGQLPFDYRWRSFSRPTGRYLEIRLPHSVVSISQVADAKKQPRSVQFRDNGRMNNEPFFNLPEFADEQELKGLPHFLMVHGYQSLTFSHLAVPHPLHHRDYRYISPNLLDMPHIMPAIGPEAENTDRDFNATELLKEEIQKWRVDHGA
jgi:hypothetical protein